MTLKVVKDYLVNCSFHGFRFIAEDRRHWTERLFWAMCCIMSWFASAILIKSSWESFQNNAVSFVVETTYLGVETSFPSISVCEDDNMAHIYNKANEMFGLDHDCNLDEVLKEIAYFKGSVYYIKEFCSENISCPSQHYKRIADDIRNPCENVFSKCRWKNVTFDCCKHFVRTKTEWGTCFTLSAINEKRGDKNSLNLVSSLRLGLASLHMELLLPVKIFMHPDADVPYYNTMTTDIITPKAGVTQRVGISVTDTENEPEVRQLSVHQRGCRFPDENILTVSSVYSYSACITECRLWEQLRQCNCSSHLMPNTNEWMHCNISGVQCLTKHYEAMSVLKTPWGIKEGLNCPCLPGCDDTEFNKIETIMEDMEKQNVTKSAVEISMYRHSSERYKRNVVRGRLDLIVSMGGTAGLFLGASILSFAEFVYFFTLRMYNNQTRKRTASD